MSSWGPGSFQNDWAADWLADLRESKDSALVRIALSVVVEHGGTKRSKPSLLERLRGRRHHTDWLTARDSSRAIAAADVVAAWLGHPGDGFSGENAIWLQQHAPSFQNNLVPLAQEAIRIVKTSSELKDLWEEGDFQEWKDSIEDLERRLRN